MKNNFSAVNLVIKKNVGKNVGKNYNEARGKPYQAMTHSFTSKKNWNTKEDKAYT